MKPSHLYISAHWCNTRSARLRQWILWLATASVLVVGVRHCTEQQRTCAAQGGKLERTVVGMKYVCVVDVRPLGGR
jgi:hypothetical protein